MATSVVYMQKEEGRNAEEKEEQTQKKSKKNLSKKYDPVHWVKDAPLPADEQNIPVLRTRNANIRRPTCKPNFLQTALRQINKEANELNPCPYNQPQMCVPECLVCKLTYRSRVRRHSRKMLRRIVQSRTPTPATQS